MYIKFYYESRRAIFVTIIESSLLSYKLKVRYGYLSLFVLHFSLVHTCVCVTVIFILLQNHFQFGYFVLGSTHSGLFSFFFHL